MNCVGRSNYAYFIGMLMSLSVLLSYGSYITYLLAVKTLQDHTLRRSEGMNRRKKWSTDLTWSRYFELWAWALTENIPVGGVGMLATLTAPLAWGFFLYHVYLIWAGMTTNESSKWSDWKDDIADGLVFRCERNNEAVTDSHLNSEIEPLIDWPISSSQQLIKREDGQPPPGSPEGAEAILTVDMTTSSTHGTAWRRVQDLSEVHNLYDLGFWDNLLDAMHM